MSFYLFPAAAYVGLLLVLVAGIVMAIKRRHLVGARASNQLIAGVGLLLMGQALDLLRPVLRTVVAGDGLGSFGIENLINGFAMLRVVLQATGIGLIIAAAIAQRPHAEGEP